MSVDTFQIVLWGTTGLLIVVLCVVWRRQELRESREGELGKRWRNATIWNADKSARVVRVARVDSASAWLDDGHGEIEVELPAQCEPLEAGWYLHVSGWMPARRAATKGQKVKISAENVRDAFPPHTPALDDRLTGRGERNARLVSRLLGLRGL
ncbi:hypothetical protein ACYX8G_00180 [Microbacterium saperdae]